MTGTAFDLAPLVPFLLVPAVLGLAFWLRARAVKRAREWAERVGWRYVGSDPSLPSRWSGQPFGAGRQRRASKVVTGPYQGREAVSFVYRYTTGSGKNQRTVTFHVVALRLPTYLPTLELTPEGVGARIAKAFGAQDIQLESEEFNGAWRVSAPIRRFAHDVLTPRLMERLLQPDARGLSLRIEGMDLLCWSMGGRDLDAVAPRLAVMSAIADAIPRYVWLDHGYDPLNH